MRIGLWPSLGCLFAGLLAACAAHADTWRIGFGTDKPPYIFEAEQRGLEYDIVAEAAKRAGATIQPIFAPMERLYYMFDRKEVDGIATTNAQGGLQGFFSKPYIEYHNVAAALAAKGLKIERIGDLSHYSISAFQRARKLLGSEFEAMAIENKQYREEANQITRNRLLYAGRVDVIIGDRRIIEYFNQKVGDQVDVAQPLAWYHVFPPTPYQMAFLKEDHRRRFDLGLAALRKSGAYQEIEKRYVANK